MLFRFIVSFISVFGLLSSVHAHDFWLEPEHFQVNAGESVHMNFMVGHERDRWSVNKDRIVSFELIGADGARNIADIITPGTDGGADIVLKKNGVYIVSLETNNAFIELDPETFNAYLEGEGLTAVQAFRKAHKLEGRPGRELYSRRAKTIIRSGVAKGADPTETVACGLEIRPLADPFDLPEDTPLPVEIIFNGEPLPGASVSLENLRVEIFPKVTRKTDKAGRAEFEHPKKGDWKLNVVWSVPAEDDRADYETIFSSLTFSYD